MVSFLSCGPISVVVAFPITCRSNATHIKWRSGDSDSKTSRELSSVDLCIEEPRSVANNAAYRYLYERVFPFDKPFLGTLGYHTDDEEDIDGLSNGLVEKTIMYALDAKVQFQWTDALPYAMWNEYVLNYVHLNEARSNWRPFLFEKLSPSLWQTTTTTTTYSLSIPDVVSTINTVMWDSLAQSLGHSNISFVSGSTPLVFDPMSILVNGFGSCTGLSILFTSALRSVGVPARVAGTPAWNNVRRRGNHNWVEVWYNDTWYFLEPTPNVDEADNMLRPPCSRWFCHPRRWENGTKAYAARYEPTENYFPMAWEWTNTDVPAEDRSVFYQHTCNEC